MPYVRLIRLRNLVPDAHGATLQEWPFAVKICAFGQFTVLRDDEPLKFARKSPKKPLELLQGLVALGGKNVSEHVLAAALWPRVDDPARRRAAGSEALRLRSTPR